MRHYQPIDKDITWDDESLEITLYLKDGYRLANLDIRTNVLNFELLSGRKEETDVCSSFMLPIAVRAERNQISQGSIDGRRTVSIRLKRAHFTTPGRHPERSRARESMRQLVS